MRYLTVRSQPSQQGAVLNWAAATMPLLITLAVLAAEVLNWQVVSHELQTVVDAAALVGAQARRYVARSSDASGLPRFR